LYLHLHSKYLVPTEIVSTSITTFKKTEQKYLFVYWFYIGAAFSILLYNLLLFIQLRDKVYLYYILYVTCLLIWISLDTGLFLYFNSNIKLYYFLSIGSPTMAFFLTLFTREILKIRQVSKWMDTSLIVMSVIYLLIAILVAFDVYYYQFLGLIAMPFTLFLLFVGVYGMIKKLPLSKFYVLASSLYIIGLFMYAGLTLNVIPYTPLTRYGFMIGSFLELIVFSLALGYKIKLIQAEKLKFQEKIVENERLMNKNLEIKVKERTEELLATSEQLENTNALLSIQIDDKDIAIKALKKSDSKLKESNDTKDKFFSIIAHDLRSPFNNILGFSELLIENSNNYEAAETEKYLGIINSSANNTLILLDNLLNWAKSQTGKISFNPEKIILSNVILEIIKLKKSIAKAKNISLNYFSSDEIEVYADENMLKTVLRNLIFNAIKFTKLGGHINIYAVSIQDHVEISISDNGVGMKDETRKKLFNISTNITTKGTANEKGSGLGLVLCKEFVEKLGGNIWVESEEGKGSTFHFTLPYKSETIKENSSKNEILPPVEASPIKKLKILIVEDDETSEEFLSITVRKFGKEIINVKTGKDAVEACLNNPDIDLVLMDILLPEMDGHEATRQIRKFNNDVIIIAQTAYALEGDKEKAIAAGCDDYLPKPIKADELKQMIRKYL